MSAPDSYRGNRVGAPPTPSFKEIVMPQGPYPDYGAPDVPTARDFLNEIIPLALAGHTNAGLGAIMNAHYGLILAHAMLERQNHAHGLLRTYVKKDGSAKTAASAPDVYDSSSQTAWTNVQSCFTRLSATTPPPDFLALQAALNEIDHGGGGGVV